MVSSASVDKLDDEVIAHRRQDGGDFNFHADVGPHQAVDDAEHGGGLVADDLFAHRQVGGRIVTAGDPLAHVDNVGELGAGLAERPFDIGPALPGFVGEVLRHGAVFAQAGRAGDENQCAAATGYGDGISVFGDVSGHPGVDRGNSGHLKTPWCEVFCCVTATSSDVFRDDHSARLVTCDDVREGGGGLIQAAGTRSRHAQPTGGE